MAFITLAGTLRDPTSELAVGDQIRFTHKSTTGETVEGAVSVLTIDPSGTYSKDLQYGLVLVEYKDVRTSQFKNLGVATVNGSNPATSIPELLNALVPVSSAELIEFQAILADAVTARNEAEAFAASIDLINDLSQTYIFDTVAEYKASSIVFPAGKTVHLNDRGADFKVVAGTGTATGNGIIASATVNQSVSIVQKTSNTIDMYGAATGLNSSSAINEAIAIHFGYLGATSSGYILDAQIDFISGTCTGLKGQGEIDTVFNKAFSGNAIINNNQGATFSDFWIVGDSATYTGGGMYMVSDDSHIERVRITDTEDCTIIFKANDSVSNTVDDCFLQTANDGYAIRGDGIDNSPSPSARVFNRIRGGSPIVNFAGMNRAILSNSFGTRIGFDSNCSKIGVHNNRLTNATSDVTVLGLSHVFTGNITGFGTGFNLIIDSTCGNVTYDDSNSNSINGASDSPITDNSPQGAVGNTNSIYMPIKEWATEWKGTTSDGSFNNSTVSSFYGVTGRFCHFGFSVIMGSTGSVPQGFWSFTMPFKASILSSGAVQLKETNGTWHTLVWRVFGGSNQLFMTYEGSGTVDNNTFPFGTNAQIEASILFPISPS